MSNLIVIRIVPESPVKAGDFTNYLNHLGGLQITAYDLSFNSPTAGQIVGSAVYVAPTAGPNPSGAVSFNSGDIPAPPNYGNTRIAQQVDLLPAGPNPISPSFDAYYRFESVATAVIEIPSPPAGQTTFENLRLVAAWGSGANSQSIPISSDYYNVALTPGPPPDPMQWSTFPPSLYFSLPAPPTTASAVSFTFPSDGTPPPFQSLLSAVQSVLKIDPAGTTPDLGKLTEAQCRNIAYEIVWSQQKPLPTPPGPDPTDPAALTIEKLYTNPPNTGALFGTTPNPNEGDRQQFEGNLQSYYAIHNAEADRLTGFVYTLSAAIACSQFSQNAPTVRFQFPIIIDPSKTTPAGISEAAVLLTNGIAPMNPSFVVPEEYFYALGIGLPSQVTPQQQYQMACLASEQQILAKLHHAIDTGIISTPVPPPNPQDTNAPTITPEQAARQLNALGVVSNTGPSCQLNADLQALTGAWLGITGDDTAITTFWKSAVTTFKSGYLDLVLCAITGGFQPLIAAIEKTPPSANSLGIGSVDALINVSAETWQTFFNNNPNLLPPFIATGSTTDRAKAFVRQLQKFFTVSSGSGGPSTPTLGSSPMFSAHSGDPLQTFISHYGILAFGPTFPSQPAFQNALDATFLNDEAAKAWLTQVLETINALYILTANGIPQASQPGAPDLRFSVMEALYARGFISLQSVQDLTQADFQESLTGTVAYNYAVQIYQNAQAAKQPVGQGGQGFQPINPDGCLVNCVPPLYLSPLGPVAYLQEMLKVSEASTCENPLPTGTQSTLGSLIAQRRGSLGSLQVTEANLETPLPLIDIVNECLEYMGSVQSPTNGTVYDTSADALAGHALCKEDNDPKEDNDHACHDPITIFAALPEYSTPASPVAKNQSVEPLVFNKLKVDFSACGLPYSQALDVSRTYLRHLRTSRFEEMRTFRKCITEFVLDPVNEPSGFQSHLWRYPVRIDTAIEYLGITPEEYQLLFQGSRPQPCGKPVDDGVSRAIEGVPVSQLYGFAVSGEDNSWIKVVVKLPEFLSRTCLDYCEFLELWKAGFVKFSNGIDRKSGIFPECEPCCLEDLWLTFPEALSAEEALYQLAIFIRLWRKLRAVCGTEYSFTQLYDICNVFQLFIGKAINPEFLRQLAAFQMLRDHLQLKLVDTSDKPPANPTGADRTHLLALWVGESARKWYWAVAQLIDGIDDYAEGQHKCIRRSPKFVKLLASNLDALSRLAGFDPGVVSDTWHALPTHTLRFAEVLAKIYASNFSIGELLYLFTADDQLDGEEPFPLQEEDEALDAPLSLPDDEHKHSLWRLRHKLLEVHLSDEEVCQWTWKRIEASLRDEFGYAAGDVLSFAQHFFPSTLEASGYYVDAKNWQFSTSLALANTTATIWDTPPDGPFQYDSNAQLLQTQLPLTDEDVIEQLKHVHALDAQEQLAVQNLYFQPRTALAAFALVFTDFDKAEKHLIEEREERERWAYFQRQFALCHVRCRIIAEHLADHVAFATGQECPEGAHVALLLLRELFADENKATTDWEDDSGKVPSVTWTPPPNGRAFAALLGLTGTGLLREFTPDGGSVIWRDVSAVGAFGRERDRMNCPLPTILPSMHLALTPAQMNFVGVRNGLAMKDANGAWLGGAQGFSVKWTGALLIDEEGTYEFCAGAPTREGEKPDREAAEYRKWRVTLKSGQRTWLLLNHHWQGEKGHAVSSLSLERGVYELIIEFLQPSPAFSDADELYRQHTGFQLKYEGPDSHGELLEIPHSRLFRISKDQDLGAGITDLADGASNFLRQYYTSTLRDIRRTYQRAFKALLFAHRFGLAAKLGGQSELGYMLAQKENFAGVSYYRTGGGFTKHAADFDFNFLPVQDNYDSPAKAQDSRVQPSVRRTQALFDWWERTFDYDRVRKEVRLDCERHLWPLFEEAQKKQPVHPASLLRHMCADERHWQIDLRYYQDQNSQVYAVTSTDLVDDRWVVRVWHADRWIRRLLQFFRAKESTRARPDLWASLDPSALVTGETETGNANLSAFLSDGCFEKGKPRRYEDVKRLNDGLRERGREALLQYLCRMNRVALPWQSGQFAIVPRDLSDLLLLDVQTDICEKASRIEEAITAVQTFIGRSRLGLEPNWKVSRAFARLWDSRFKTYRIWERCKYRELYRENWIDWDELEKAERTEAFRFLEAELQRTILTVPRPGGMEYWSDQRPPAHPELALLQRHDPSHIQQLAPPPQPEGLDLLGTPEHDARSSWLAALHHDNATASNGNRPTIRAEVTSPQPGAAQTLPLWIQAAIRLNVRFLRMAAASEPPASTSFSPQHAKDAAGCCCECGKPHPAVVDEYYFWLLDSRYYVEQEQDAGWDWANAKELPKLLHWNGEPMVHLAWCRVHNGEFQQPRRSDEGVRLHSTSTPQLELVGRASDSLTFKVDGGIAPPGYTDPEAQGFRYDLVTDAAVTLPLLVAPPPGSNSYPGGLSAYPYFAYFEPGAGVMPPSLFSPALAVASALRTHCRFEEALKWYELVFSPLREDCSWCSQDTQNTPTDGTGQPTRVAGGPHPVGVLVEHVGEPAGNVPNETGGPHPVGVLVEHVGEPAGNATGTASCCSSVRVSDQVAQNRSITLHYLETLLQWGDALLRHKSPEAFQQARLIFDTAERILGRRPRSVKDLEVSNGMQGQEPQVVLTFVSECAPLNPRLLDFYEQVDDRLALIHSCLDARRLRNGRLDRDMPYWGNDPLRNGWQTTTKTEMCADEEEQCCPHSPYRFMFLIQKAQEIAGQVRELGAALLAAFEKGDAEYLTSLRALHERQLLDLTLDIRQYQWREADWQVQALQKTLEETQARLNYYTGLIQNGLISNEVAYQALMDTSLMARAAATISEGIGQSMITVPDFWFGAAGFGGSPLSYNQFPLGTKLSALFAAAARISNIAADIASTTASLDLTQAGWDRRLQEWQFQVQVLTIQIEQIMRQILAAERRRDIALRELNNHQQQMEHAAEVLNFLRDKFTNHALYLFLQQETASLHGRMYELALCAARQAQRAFNYERGHTTRHFLPGEIWDNLHEGLLAGERLQLSLRQMEKAYLDENVREYELMKHFSLRLHFPLEFLRLKETGCCEIEIPEWMFDLDYPGHYMRRIKNVTLTLPCVVGPYTGVHCRLTLLSSTTRVHLRMRDPLLSCCDDDDFDNGYHAVYDDPRIVTQYAATEAIATSSGQNDSGLFELNFRDERYLPFEFEGAVSRWRIELPQENNQFDIDTLTDMILHLNYMAREGGEVLRRVANESAQRHLPGAGVRYFDIRHEFPDAWHRFQGSFTREEAPKHLGVQLSRDMFPFIPGHRELWINRLDIFFEAPDAEPGQHKVVKFLVGHRAGQRHEDREERHEHREERHEHREERHEHRDERHKDRDERHRDEDRDERHRDEDRDERHKDRDERHRDEDRDERDEDRDDREVHKITCVASDEWPDLYHGVLDIRLGPLAQRADHDLGTFRFPTNTGTVSRAFLLCHYEVDRKHSGGRFPMRSQ